MELYLMDVSHEFEDDGIETYVYDIVVPSLERTVGRCEYRVESGQDLRYYGNIGYVIYVPYRGHHFAYKACLALIALMKGKIKGLQEIVITCNPENIASKKTIQKLGCDYVETVDIDPRHELFRMGDVQKEVYVLNLSDNT